MYRKERKKILVLQGHAQQQAFCFVFVVYLNERTASAFLHAGVSCARSTRSEWYAFWCIPQQDESVVCFMLSTEERAASIAPSFFTQAFYMLDQVSDLEALLTMQARRSFFSASSKKRSAR